MASLRPVDPTDSGGAQSDERAHKVLFGPLAHIDPAGAVVRRVRAAVGLGLLDDGERLPKEADLANQLGVSVFALREALGTLRDQGLVVTRAGKYGGSSIRHPPDKDMLAYDELVRLSSAELRDLGDWRKMLAASAAAVAAERASDSNFAELVAAADEVATAETNQEARRAHGRFHFELASSAQSLRMTRAEYSVHEEIDWLYGLALQTAEQRRKSAAGLSAVARAVQSRDPDSARRTAEQYSTDLVGQLIRLRLAALADPRRVEIGSLSSTFTEELVSVQDKFLQPLARLAEVAASAIHDTKDSRALRTWLSGAILQAMADLPLSIDGLGIMAERDVVTDHPLWMEWWHNADDGPIRETHHVLDPTRDDFYDYLAREPMARTRSNRGPWIAGPYVDYGGVDDYILTVSVPIMRDGQFLGAAAVDFLAAEFERRMAPWLAKLDDDAFVLNGDNRVVVSNTPRCIVGDLVRVEDYSEPQLLHAAFPWKLIVLPT